MCYELLLIIKAECGLPIDHADVVQRVKTETVTEVYYYYY